MIYDLGKGRGLNRDGGATGVHVGGLLKKTELPDGG